MCVCVACRYTSWCFLSLSLFLQKVSPFERQIQRDLTRTFPEHSFFKDRDGLGQESLLNVMKVRRESGCREEAREGERRERGEGKGGGEVGREGDREKEESDVPSGSCVIHGMLYTQSLL